MLQQIETHNDSHHHPHLAWPRCGKTSMVHYNSVYSCLNCGFRRDVAERHGGLGVLAAIASGGGLLLLLLL